MFTDKGIAFITAIWGIIMGILTYFTDIIKLFAPLSYGLIISLGLFIGLHLCRLFNSIFTTKYTSRPTFIEYKMEKGRINLIKKSNIWAEPNFMLNVTLIPDSPPIQANNARNQKRLEAKTPTTFKEHELKTATIQTTFDKPIAPESFHIHLVKDVGQCPAILHCSITMRNATVVLGELTNDCSFRIWFNEEVK